MEAKRKAEEEKKEALAAELEKSQERESIAVQQQKKAEERVQTERKRMDYIVSVSNIDTNNVLPSMHSVYNLSVLGKKQIAKFKKHFHLIPSKLYPAIEALGEINTISFTDDGDGLDEQVQDINDIFEFGYTTTSGAGLGLYYSKKYVEEMGGTLKALRSTPTGLSIVAEWKRED